MEVEQQRSDFSKEKLIEEGVGLWDEAIEYLQENSNFQRKLCDLCLNQRKENEILGNQKIIDFDSKGKKFTLTLVKSDTHDMLDIRTPDDGVSSISFWIFYKDNFDGKHLPSEALKNNEIKSMSFCFQNLNLDKGQKSELFVNDQIAMEKINEFLIKIWS